MTEDSGPSTGPVESCSKPEPTPDTLSSQRVFKKSSPNNKLTLYLSSRDLVVSQGRIDRLQGVLLLDPEFVEQRKVYGQVTLTFRYGREDEEVMGLKFCNEAVMCLAQLYPPQSLNPDGITPLQEALLKRLGPNAYPFSMEITPLAPPSVQLVPAKEYNGAPIGTSYDVRAYVAERADEKLHRRTTVRMGIRVVQRAIAPPCPSLYNPQIGEKDRSKSKITLFGCRSAPVESKMMAQSPQSKAKAFEANFGNNQIMKTSPNLNVVGGEFSKSPQHSPVKMLPGFQPLPCELGGGDASLKICENKENVTLDNLKAKDREKVVDEGKGKDTVQDQGKSKDKNAEKDKSKDKIAQIDTCTHNDKCKAKDGEKDKGNDKDNEKGTICIAKDSLHNRDDLEASDSLNRQNRGNRGSSGESGSIKENGEERTPTHVTFKDALTNGIDDQDVIKSSEQKASDGDNGRDGNKGDGCKTGEIVQCAQVEQTELGVVDDNDDNQSSQLEHIKSLCSGKRPSLAAFLAEVPPPQATVEKQFLLSDGKVVLEGSLNKGIYYHGEDVQVTVNVRNNSSKTIKRIKVFIVQHVDVCMFSNGKFKNVVAMINSKEDCPVASNQTLYKTYTLIPIKSSTKNWIALEDSYTKTGTSLASSVTCGSNNPEDRNVFAIYVSYYVKVKLLVSVMGGEISLKLPFTLMHTCGEFDPNNTLTRVVIPSPINLEKSPSLAKKAGVSSTADDVKQEKDGT